MTPTPEILTGAAADDALRALFQGQRVLLLHAHPDDETLQSGLLMAWLLEHDVPVTVLTATRGERGEIVEGVLDPATTPEQLVAVRLGEREAALAEFGEIAHGYLGEAPARADGREPRHYRDSGMRWITPRLAGPELTADGRVDPATFAGADLAEEVADALAGIAAFGATVVVGYDEHGTYGHPDHVRAHEVARAAAQAAGVAFVELGSDPALEAVDLRDFTHLDLARYQDVVRRALLHFRTQLTAGPERIVHVGGQPMDYPDTCVLRRAF